MGRHEILLDIDELADGDKIDPRDALRIIRNEKGMTVKELAVRAGIQIGSRKPYRPAYVGRIERKLEEASDVFLKRSAKVIGVPFDVLMNMNKAILMGILESSRLDREELLQKYLS